MCLKRVKSVYKRARYICEYEIPMIVLLLGRGLGYYPSSGYDCGHESEVEYIIPNHIIKSKWLKKYYLENNEKIEMTF